MLKVEVGNVPGIANIWNSNVKAAFSLNKHLPTNILNKCPSCAFQWLLKVAQESFPAFIYPNVDKDAFFNHMSSLNSTLV